MTRTTILTDDDLMLAIRSAAQRQGLSVSEVIRRALAGYVRTLSRKPLPSFSGAGRSGGKLRISERHEELLFQDGFRRS